MTRRIALPRTPRSVRRPTSPGELWAREEAAARRRALEDRERDEARAEVARSHDAILHLTREVERLEGLILDWEVYRPGRGDCINNLLIEARRIRAQREEKP